MNHLPPSQRLTPEQFNGFYEDLSRKRPYFRENISKQKQHTEATQQELSTTIQSPKTNIKDRLDT